MSYISPVATSTTAIALTIFSIASRTNTKNISPFDISASTMGGILSRSSEGVYHPGAAN